MLVKETVRVFVAALARDPQVRLPQDHRVQQRLELLFPAGTLAPPVIDPVTGVTLHAWLRLDNHEALAAELGEDIPHASHDPAQRFAHDAAIVLAAYRTWGTDCVAHLDGDFAFTILDPRDGTAFAARDAVGIRPLYFALTGDVFVASPTAAVFDLFDGVDTSIRPEWLADFIHGMSGDWRATPMPGVHRLPPGHWLRVGVDEVTEQRYHQFDADAVWEDTRDPAWLEAYRTELIRAVSVRTEPAGRAGVETSGGIDSSTIPGVMAHAHPERISDIHTFGFCGSPDFR